MNNTKKNAKQTRKSRSRGKQQWHGAVIADYARLSMWPNVERIATGWKERRGKLTSQFCVKIYVNEKKRKIRKEHIIPKRATVLVPAGKGLYRSVRVPTDVVWHSPITFCAAAADFLNPTAGGALLGVPGGDVGTYACMVANSAGALFALTAGHVLRTGLGNVPQNLPVAQPPTIPPNLPAGESISLGRTRGGFVGNTDDGFLDFGIIELRQGRQGISMALDGVTLNGQILDTASVVNGKVEVSKFGAITGRTGAGFSAMLDATIISGLPVTKVFEFRGSSGSAFGQNGDSGALVISTSTGSAGAVVGILFATAPPTPDAPAGRGFVVPFDRIPGLTVQ